MAYNVLVTGGAGFIGSFIVDELLRRGHQVRIFDALVPQVHQGKIPAHLNPKAEFIQGDIRDRAALENAMQGVDVIFHKAAEVGVGQSMHEIARYVGTNTLGTANLLDILVNNESIRKNVKKLIVASSMSSYGEGMYSCPKCGPALPKERTEEQMKGKDWEMHCAGCNSVLKPLPTTEDKPQEQTSVYAITKKTQEDLCLTIGKAFSIPTVALRYFNVHGPRQSLSNPYTGVAAIFMSRLKNNQAPMIFEDGNQMRDFVSVHDIVQANMLAMEKDEANYQAFNVGSGSPISIKQVAQVIADVYGKKMEPVITHNFRKGDIRHCFADISKIQRVLGFKPSVSFKDGMKELIAWSDKATAVDTFSKVNDDLKKRNIIV